MSEAAPLLLVPEAGLTRIPQTNAKGNGAHGVTRPTTNAWVGRAVPCPPHSFHQPSTISHQRFTNPQLPTTNRFSNHDNRRRSRAGNQLDGFRLREGEERDGWFGH